MHPRVNSRCASGKRRFRFTDPTPRLALERTPELQVAVPRLCSLLTLFFEELVQFPRGHVPPQRCHQAEGESKRKANRLASPSHGITVISVFNY